MSNFGSSSLSAPTADNETNKIAEAFNRIGRFKRWVKNSIFGALKFVKNKLTNQIASIQPAGEIISLKSVWIENGCNIFSFAFRPRRQKNKLY